VGHQPWETPFGQVTPEGMKVVEALYSGYGEINMGKIQEGGNKFLKVCRLVGVLCDRLLNFG
jgi:hypothetical protein